MPVQEVENGKFVDSSAASSAISNLTSKKGSTLDKDAFLQLLVAQMKYQDPLEPTSNTEFISQFATFSSLEEMQNLRTSMDIQRAGSLVGRTVMLKVNDSESGFVSGRVDYIKVENGKPYLVINETPYDLDTLDTVFEDEYLNAYMLAADFVAALSALPPADKLTLEHEEAVTKLQKAYEAMTDYQKSFIAGDLKKALDAAIAKIAELKGDDGSGGTNGGGTSGS